MTGRRTYFEGDVRYVDRKRSFWLLSPLYAVLPAVSVGLTASLGQEVWLWLMPVVFYAVAPCVDFALGEDESNPPEIIVPQLEADRYYRLLTYLTVPCHLASLCAAAWWVGTQQGSWLGTLAITLAAGLAGGLAIVTGHELGHKTTRLERLLAKLVLSIPAYGHFLVEHNRGHHRDVATPADTASARMGESIYRFAKREILGGIARGWGLERERLARRGRSVFSAHNEILQSGACTLAVRIPLVLGCGWPVIPFLVVHDAFSWWQLTSANYIEHYGLLRSRTESGRYQRCEPWHSWNSNHVVGNLMLFQLERHSDHHAHPGRRYQSLRHFESVPRLPMSYGGMYLLALIPPLWFHVMDPRLLRLDHVRGRLDRVNLDPLRRPTLLRQYGQSATEMGSG